MLPGTSGIQGDFRRNIIPRIGKKIRENITEHDLRMHSMNGNLNIDEYHDISADLHDIRTGAMITNEYHDINADQHDLRMSCMECDENHNINADQHAMKSMKIELCLRSLKFLRLQWTRLNSAVVRSHTVVMNSPPLLSCLAWDSLLQ